jgi:hypothetical protein
MIESKLCRTKFRNSIKHCYSYTHHSYNRSKINYKNVSRICNLKGTVYIKQRAMKMNHDALKINQNLLVKNSLQLSGSEKN